MKNIVEKFLKKKNLLNEKANYIIAFSGGFDSMALADILINLAEEYGFKVILAHLNHNWRGNKSKREEVNCANFAKEHNVTFYTETLPKDLPHTETIAREERYSFLERTAKKFKAKGIFTAHTKSDNIETVLQRIIKGTGISGLQGIKEVRELENTYVYRPLLNVSRAEILNYCKEKNLNPNNDNSNKDIAYFRNKIRARLIPELKKSYDENVENAIARLIENAKDAEKIIDEFSRRELIKVYDEEKILTKEFKKLSLPMKKRLIKELLEKNNFDYDQKRVGDILNFLEKTSESKAGKTFSLSNNQWLFVNHKLIEIIDETRYNFIHAQKEINMEGETYLKELNCGVIVSKWEGKAPKIFPKENESIAYVDFSKVEQPLVLRTRIEGDKIVPFGKNSPIKLKKYLNNKNLSKHEKSKVLLICSSKEVLWVINQGISNSIRVTDMPTHKVEFFIRSENG